MIQQILIAGLILSAIVALLPWLPGRLVPMGWTLVGGITWGVCFWLLVVLR